MPPSLRKRISKRSPRKTEKKVTVSPGSSSPLLAALDRLQKPIAASNESLELVPPPLMLPREPDNVRCSPSKSLLQRYRGRNAMEIAVPTITRDAPVTRSRSRDSAFTEDFGDDRKRSRSPKSRSSSIKSTIRKVGGIDFEMLNAAHSPLKLPQRSKSAEPARARSPAESDDSSSDPLFHRRPTSRSQTREKERSDSTIGDADGDALTLGDVLALKAKGPSPGSESPRAQSPRRPSVLKKKNSDPAIAARPKIPRVTRSTAKAGKQNTSTQKETVRPVGSDDEISTDSTSDDSSSDCTFTLDTTTGIVGRSPRKSDPGPQPTQVVPPVNVGDILPGLLWTSPLGGTSRPDSPWLWCKRWTCCRCAANTIVEQHVCANLKCGHRRCGKQCKVVRDKRVYTI